MKSNGKFLAVTGRPGIYEVKGQSKSGLLVRHIENGKIHLATPLSVSFLDDIVIYTENDKLSLPEVLLRIDAGDAALIPGSKASSRELKDYFKQIIPDYDADKFYPSHMKKILQWYHILRRTGRIDELRSEKPENKS